MKIKGSDLEAFLWERLSFSRIYKLGRKLPLTCNSEFSDYWVINLYYGEFTYEQVYIAFRKSGLYTSWLAKLFNLDSRFLDDLAVLFEEKGFS